MVTLTSLRKFNIGRQGMSSTRFPQGIEYFGAASKIGTYYPSTAPFPVCIQFTQTSNEGFVWSFRTKFPHSNDA